MTDEKLENKVRKARKAGWKEVVGAVAVTAGVFGGMLYVAHHFYGKGHEAGVYEGRKAGVVEEKEQALNLKIGLYPKGSQYYVLLSAEQTKDGEKVAYQLMASPHKVYPGESGEGSHIDITRVFEEVIVEREDGTNVIYIDGDMDVSGGGEADCLAGPRDGLVDAIRVTPYGKDSSLLCRVRDFDANPTVFDKADAIFNEIRAQYFDSEQ